MSNHSENSFTRFLSGKGFYFVLALCLAGAGAAAYLAGETAPGAVTEPEPQPAPMTQPDDHEEWTFPQFEEAAGSQPGVAVEKNRGAASSSGESSSQQPSPAQQKESAASEMPASSPKLSLIQPVDGEVFTQYSNGELVKSETLGDWRTHNGIDIAAAEGTPVKAAAKGSVTGVRSDALWGYVVEITHPDGTLSSYCGLAKQPQVKKGDDVALGQVIGAVGYLPAESLMPSHLHFECRRDGKYVDPMSLIGK